MRGECKGGLPQCTVQHICLAGRHPRRSSALTTQHCGRQRRHCHTGGVADGLAPVVLAQHSVDFWAEPGGVPELKHEFLSMRQNLGVPVARMVGGWVDGQAEEVAGHGAVAQG